MAASMRCCDITYAALVPRRLIHEYKVSFVLALVSCGVAHRRTAPQIPSLFLTAFQLLPLRVEEAE
jgi:hypothetical protein